MTANKYAIASGLKGFGIHTSLRVRVLEVRGDYVWVITADMADAGTRLVLDPSQLTDAE